MPNSNSPLVGALQKLEFSPLRVYSGWGVKVGLRENAKADAMWKKTETADEAEKLALQIREKFPQVANTTWITFRGTEWVLLDDAQIAQTQAATARFQSSEIRRVIAAAAAAGGER